MKKLVIAAIAMGFAVASQAASIKWSFTNASADYAGSTLYLIEATSLPTEQTFKDAKDLASFLKTANDLTSRGTSYSKGKYTNASSLTVDDITKAKSYYFMFVNADGSQVQTTALLAGSDIVYDTGAQETAKTTTVTPATGWMTVGNVPEPTSAMLLLLGVAGLALRRRHA